MIKKTSNGFRLKVWLRVRTDLPDKFYGVARPDFIRRDVLTYDTAGADNRPVADGDAFQDNGISANENVVSDDNGGGADLVNVMDSPLHMIQGMEIRVPDADIAAAVDVFADRNAGGAINRYA